MKPLAIKHPGPSVHVWKDRSSDIMYSQVGFMFVLCLYRCPSAPFGDIYYRVCAYHNRKYFLFLVLGPFLRVIGAVVGRTISASCFAFCLPVFWDMWRHSDVGQAWAQHNLQPLASSSGSRTQALGVTYRVPT